MTTRVAISKIFAGIVERYELVNHIITLCLDCYWRWRTVAIAVGDSHVLALDLCSGTGDMALSLLRASKGKAMVIAVDICPQMALKASYRLRKHGVHFIVADAMLLPFRDHAFDIITISFGIRNIFKSRVSFVKWLAEVRQKLRDGGKLILLETSQPEIRPIMRLFHWYVRFVVRWLGGWLSGSPSAYRYLSDTIIHFVDAKTLAQMLLEAGFKKVHVFPFLFGIVVAHIAIK
ncbi:MAG: hypothetical protein RUDDFDWM_000907 [Candidatus Fervidibacterota bacterium]